MSERLTDKQIGDLRFEVSMGIGMADYMHPDECRQAKESLNELIAELRSLRAECEAAREKRIYKCQHGVTGWCKDCASIVLD